jgi:hypothetical protein
MATFTPQEAFEIAYNNSVSHLISTNVQDAVDELKSDINGITPADASHVPYSNAVSHLPVTNVQQAIDTLHSNDAFQTALLANTNGVLYVNPARTDPYQPTGNINMPFKSISAAINASSSGYLLFLAPFTYYENVFLPDGVSITGTETTFTVITGDVRTGNYVSAVSNLTVNGSLTTFGDSDLDSVTVNGNVIVNGRLDTEELVVTAAIGAPLTINASAGTEEVNLHFAVFNTGDASSCIIQHGGLLRTSFAFFKNNSLTAPCLLSDNGSFRIISSNFLNVGGGLSISGNNGSTISSPNVLADQVIQGNAVLGDAFTYLEAIHFVGASTITGSQIVTRPATLISYNVANTGIPLVYPNQTVQAAIDYTYSSSKSGITDPTYTPVRAPEYFFNTVNHKLWIWDGTGWHYTTLT